MNDIIPRFYVPLAILTDNGPAFLSRSFETTLRRLSINQLFAIIHNPTALMRDNMISSTISLPSRSPRMDKIGTCTCPKNESMGLSPFKFLYEREPVLPLDILLKPRGKYLAVEPFELFLKEQHKAFL